MSSPKRATIYFEPGVHKALRLKAVHTEKSISDLVNVAVRRSLAEDAEDRQAFETRKKEPSLLFENVLKDLKRRGKL
ncbi:MAG: CopG family transcriptional regulator [Acidobacteriota bacterium]|nr:CopG family transcriptional regulator [Acidobacteriota bacterium]